MRILRFYIHLIGQGPSGNDLESAVDDYPEQVFDYAILTQTLQETRDPLRVLRGMLRVARRGIVSSAGTWAL